MNFQNFQLFYTVILEDVQYQLKNFPINKVEKCLCIKIHIHDYYFENQRIQEWNTRAIYKMLSLLTDGTDYVLFYMPCRKFSILHALKRCLFVFIVIIVHVYFSAFQTCSLVWMDVSIPGKSTTVPWEPS